MSYTNLNNPANYQLQSFGQDGMRTISTTQAYVEGEYYRVLVATEDSTVSATSMVGDDLVEVDVFAGTTIYGLFTAVSVSLGEVTAYLAGRTDIDDVWAYIRAYGEANGAIIEGEDCAKAAISPLLDKYYAQASLVMVPSLYKTSIVYSERPLSTDGQLTFTRNSDASRVNSDGLVEKVRANVLPYSNTFSDASWAKPRSSVTSGQTGYDGSSNAWKLESTDAADSYVARGLTQSGIQTFSVYAKAGNVNYIYFRIAGTTSQGAYIDLSDGSVSSYFNEANIIGGAVVNNIGSGWYRISIAVNTTTSEVRFYVSDSGTITSAIGSFIYIQNAQLEQGLVATDYLETTTSARSTFAGITVDGTSVPNVPRLDYSGGASCPRLLLEPQRTNLVTYSEYLADYPINRGSVSSNAATSPEGVQNATSLVPTTDNGDHTILFTNSLSATTYTLSCFAKNNGNDISLTFAYNSSNWTGCIFDLANGVAKTPQTSGAQAVCTANIEPYGDGYYRCSITATLWTAYASWFSFVSLVNDADGSLSSWGRQSFVGVPSETAYLYGLQLEQGSYSTSYIPTLGSAVTRLADAAVKTGISSLINSTEGVIFFEMEALADDLTYRGISLSDGTFSNLVQIRFQNTSNSIAAQCRVSNSNEALITAPFTTTQKNKIAFRYKQNDFALFINGELKGTDTSGSTFTANTLTAFRTDRGDGADIFYGELSQALILPALTNAQLAELTTL